MDNDFEGLLLGAPPSAIDRRPRAQFGFNDKVFCPLGKLSNRRTSSFERRKAKTSTPKAKTKASEERRRPARRRRRRRQAKRDEDQRAEGEDEGKRREAKVKAPTAKTTAPIAKSKTSEGRHRIASVSETAKGSCPPSNDVRVWAKWAVMSQWAEGAWM